MGSWVIIENAYSCADSFASQSIAAYI